MFKTNSFLLFVIQSNSENPNQQNSNADEGRAAEASALALLPI